jgi:hypothetical protein
MGLFNFFHNNRPHKRQIKVPNGWGRQNYEHRANKAVFSEPVDLNNIKRKRGWIKAFVVNKIEGLHNRARKKWRYPMYPTTYEPLERH